MLITQVILLNNLSKKDQNKKQQQKKQKNSREVNMLHLSFDQSQNQDLRYLVVQLFPFLIIQRVHNTFDPDPGLPADHT